MTVLVDAFKQAYPEHNIADLLYADTFHQPAIKIANQKSLVYNYLYLFTWDTPAVDNFAMSFYTPEIPFVMNNLDNAEPATGNGIKAKKLAQTMSAAWTNFAKTSNPNGGDLSQWEAYIQVNSATMVFDNKEELKHKYDTKLLELLNPSYKLD
ncbi:carboxylesterase family protein [Gallibacterium anatis]|uniref:carboxylesterase family protein n=1 Tax=Gallibacterium anatis TaxID=750 RepID=UPI00300706BD